VPCQVLFIEEMTMMDAQLWSDVCKLHLSGQVACVLSGDFAQFPAILETWAGSALPTGMLETSHMVRELAGSNRLMLQKNHRSDAVLFDFYTSIFDIPFYTLPEARVLFPKTSRVAATTLVISHSKRRYINMLTNLADRPPDAVFFRSPVLGKMNGNTPQSMWLWPGIRLVGSGGPVKKGVFEIVAAVTPEEIVLESGTCLTAQQGIRCLRLSAAITYPSAQGLTLEGVVRLSCTDPKHFTKRHLYVGASRAIRHNDLEVE